MGMAGTAQHCKEKVGLKAQGISRTSLVATEGCVCGLKVRSVWQQRDGKVLNTNENACGAAPSSGKRHKMLHSASEIM